MMQKKSYNSFKINKFYFLIKRYIDFLFSLLLFVFLIPLFLIIIIAIKIDSKGPILFIQKRVGIHSKIFNIYKFRTMHVNAPNDKATNLLKDSKIWITKVGRILRKTSLDELPQVLNILKGEMSLIGPRPALWNQFNLTKERKNKGVLKIYPGITGLAQINGRDDMSQSEKVQYDFEYLCKFSFLLDMKIFLKTFLVVLSKRGFKEGNGKRK